MSTGASASARAALSPPKPAPTMTTWGRTVVTGAPSSGGRPRDCLPPRRGPSPASSPALRSRAACGYGRRCRPARSYPIVSDGHGHRSSRADVAGAGADEGGVGVLLEDVGAPPDHLAARERGREQLAGELAHLHHHARVE